MSSTYRTSDMTDLLSNLRVITECSKYSRKMSTILLIIAIPLLTLWIVRKIHCYVENVILWKQELTINKLLVTCFLVSDCSVWTQTAVSTIRFTVHSVQLSVCTYRWIVWNCNCVPYRADCFILRDVNM